MELNDIVNTKKGFSQLENQEISEKPFVPEVGKEKLEALKTSIYEINGLILEREDLSKQVTGDAEVLKREINNFLLENQGMTQSQEATDSNVMREKNDLRHKKMEISEFQIKEKIDCWKDVSLLKKELREKQREFNEKQGRINMINGFLEEN